MAVSDTSKLLIEWLNCLDMDFDDKRAILIMLDTEEKEIKMLKWFLDNRNPTKKQILNKARDLCLEG